MAVCKSCKCEPKYCGCADKAQPVAPPCEQGTADCPDPEPCGETFSAECIVWTGDDMPQFGIKKGDRLDDIIQRFILWQLSPNCINPYVSFPNTLNTCVPVTGLRTDWISQSQVKLVWTPVVQANNYTIQYSTDATTWLNITTPPNTYTTAANFFTVSNLVPDTNYYFRIISNCSSSGACNPAYSVIIQVKTLDV